MNAIKQINDGTSAPRLVVYGNVWGLSELPPLPRGKGEDVWSFERTLDNIAAAGFGGMQGGDPKQVRSRGLRYAAGSRANSVAEVHQRVREAADQGADCTTLHVGWGDEDDAEVDRLVNAVGEASEKYKTPAYIETHRSTLCQDVWRINKLIERIPGVRFNGDYSHLYCGQELCYAPEGFDTARRRLAPITARSNFFHGRISDGQCMQADAGDGSGKDRPFVSHFKTLWTDAMSAWKTRAKPGDICGFAPELGPPSSGYSITYRDGEGVIHEISNRWQQSLVIKQLAEDAFAAHAR